MSAKHAQYGQYSRFARSFGCVGCQICVYPCRAMETLQPKMLLPARTCRQTIQLQHTSNPGSKQQQQSWQLSLLHAAQADLEVVVDSVAQMLAAELAQAGVPSHLHLQQLLPPTQERHALQGGISLHINRRLSVILSVPANLTRSNCTLTC